MCVSTDPSAGCEYIYTHLHVCVQRSWVDENVHVVFPDFCVCLCHIMSLQVFMYPFLLFHVCRHAVVCPRLRIRSVCVCASCSALQQGNFCIDNLLVAVIHRT